MVLISRNLRRVEETEEYTPEDDVTKEEVEYDMEHVGDVADDDEDVDGEDGDEDGEDGGDEDGEYDDDEEGEDDDEKVDAAQSEEVIGDDLVLQLLEEELDEVDNLEEILTTPKQEPAALQNAEDDDANWGTQDDQVLPQSYEIPLNDDVLLEHDAIGTNDSVATSSDLKTVSIHKNGTYIMFAIALVFGIGLFSKFCGRPGKKDRRRHVAHKRLNMDDDFAA
jgi:hypothetical protein